QAAARLVGRDHLLDPVEDLSLAHRAAVVRAVVVITDDPRALAKDADLQTVDTEHAAFSVGKLVDIAEFDHGASSVAYMPGPVRRNHIAMSSRSRSAALTIAHAATRASVAVTASCSNTGRFWPASSTLAA